MKSNYVVLKGVAAATRDPFGPGVSTARAPGRAAVRAQVEQLDRHQLGRLASDASVIAVAPAMPMRLIQPVSARPAAAAQAGMAWGIGAVGADRSPRTGEGVVVAVIDTGIDAAHPAFAGVELVQQDFTGEGDGDPNGHGTHCANTRLFDTLADHVKARGAMAQATVIVAAAGNESHRELGPDFEISVAPPAIAEGIVSVAALGQDGSGLMVAPFSNTRANLSGPGVDIVSAAPGGGLRALSGTSMATPHVAGVAALWAEQLLARGRLDAFALIGKLAGNATSSRLAPGFDPFDVGAGLVQCPDE